MNGWSPVNSQGLCGEMSISNAGLFFGQYASQNQVKKLGGNSEILLGVNDAQAAKALKLNYQVYNAGSSILSMSSFIQSNLIAGNVVISGMYCCDSGIWSEGNDSSYDHIVNIVGSINNTSGSQDFVFLDHCRLSYRILSPPNIFSTRQGANNIKVNISDPHPELDYTFATSAVEYPFKTPMEQQQYTISQKGYLTAVSGVFDTNHETFRMMLQTNEQYEPDVTNDGVSQSPNTVTFSANIYNLTIGNSYSVLRYDSPGSVPSNNFLKTGGFTKCFNFVATYVNLNLPNFDTGMSNGTIFYRVVKSN